MRDQTTEPPDVADSPAPWVWTPRSVGIAAAVLAALAAVLFGLHRLGRFILLVLGQDAGAASLVARIILAGVLTVLGGCVVALLVLVGMVVVDLLAAAIGLCRDCWRNPARRAEMRGAMNDGGSS